MRHVIAVASGKGGVGKSTVAVNLAVCLSRLGLRVGMIDADIHGPSLPRMLGLDRKPEVRGDRMIPLQAWGITAMSIGFLVPETQAMIWRGPMVMGALEQLMGQVDWPPLDVMVIDMPPGTGDAQLTLAQRVDLAGAVIVSTPQDIALIDARRGIDMFGRTGVPILGLVENMSVFCCPNCGHRTAIFGEGGVEREATKLGMTFLGAVPLLPAIRNAGRYRRAGVFGRPGQRGGEGVSTGRGSSEEPAEVRPGALPLDPAKGEPLEPSLQSWDSRGDFPLAGFGAEPQSTESPAPTDTARRYHN